MFQAISSLSFTLVIYSTSVVHTCMYSEEFFLTIFSFSSCDSHFDHKNKFERMVIMKTWELNHICTLLFSQISFQIPKHWNLSSFLLFQLLYFHSLSIDLNSCYYALDNRVTTVLIFIFVLIIDTLVNFQFAPPSFLITLGLYMNTL